MASNQSSSSESSEVIALELPSEYEFLEVLGEGTFGQVVKCRKRDTEQVVAVKIPKGEPEDTIDEVAMMRSMKDHGIDTNNIVEFIDDFPTELGPALVFEALDISLFDYLNKVDKVPMLLSDIRAVIQQMATALDVLKGIGVIHTDVKLDNIMMVNHQLRPCKFKLIDFGLAISRSEAEQGTILQPCCLRAPEIILGLPFSEAIDMWALGCEMFLMICGDSMCEGECDYEILLCIAEILGQPADYLLNDGLMTEDYFDRTDSKSWKLKTPVDCCGDNFQRANKYYEFQSLDDLKEMRLEENNETEAVEREQCIKLLKAMLKIDPNERITPHEVLAHPFITKDYPKLQTDEIKTSRSLSFTSTNEDLECEPPATPLKDEDSINIQPDNSTPSPEINPSGMILVQPTTAENNLLLEDEESAVRLQTDEIKTSRSLSFTSTNEDLECEPPATPLKDEDSINIQPDNSTPSPEINPSGMILVQPTTAENNLLLEDEESAVRLQTDEIKTSRSLSFTSTNEDLECEPPATPLKDEDSINIQPDNSTPSPEINPSGMILVQPTTAENNLLLEDEESAVSFQSGLNEMSESSVRSTESDTKSVSEKSEDSITCEDIRTKKKKKKKNCVQRFFSWMRKAFCCCVTCVDDD